MFLKRLNVKGFKSFADRTTLEFEPGVAVVVGRAGTGKTLKDLQGAVNYRRTA